MASLAWLLFAAFYLDFLRASGAMVAPPALGALAFASTLLPLMAVGLAPLSLRLIRHACMESALRSPEHFGTIVWKTRHTIHPIRDCLESHPALQRQELLVANVRQTIPLHNTHLVNRRLSKGSRLLVALTINRSPDYQINYGTGKDVSAESIADAQEPLVVQWLGESTVTIPISR